MTEVPETPDQFAEHCFARFQALVPDEQFDARSYPGDGRIVIDFPGPHFAVISGRLGEHRFRVGDYRDGRIVTWYLILDIEELAECYRDLQKKAVM